MHPSSQDMYPRRMARALITTKKCEGVKESSIKNAKRRIDRQDILSKTATAACTASHKGSTCHCGLYRNTATIVPQLSILKSNLRDGDGANGDGGASGHPSLEPSPGGSHKCMRTDPKSRCSCIRAHTCNDNSHLIQGPRIQTEGCIRGALWPSQLEHPAAKIPSQ